MVTEAEGEEYPRRSDRPDEECIFVLELGRTTNIPSPSPPFPPSPRGGQASSRPREKRMPALTVLWSLPLPVGDSP